MIHPRSALAILLSAAAMSASLHGEEVAMKREVAAERLKAALQGSRDTKDEARQLAALCGASIKVMAAFPDNLLLRDLFVAMEPAEGMSNADLIREWQRAVTEAIRILEFQITEEAPLPEGFPLPTPLGEVRIQNYPAYRLAQTGMNGGDDSAFGALFAHITTNKIAMTAPVEIQYGADRTQEAAKASMAFLYRSRAQGQLGGDKVKVLDMKPMRVVSLGIDGPLTDERVRDTATKLEVWMKRRDLKATGPMRTMCYNSPFIPVKNQFLEVQIPIADEPARK